MGYCLSKKRICYMGHHGIKILCGFSFYSTEYFRGAGSCAFWLMRLLAFNLWYIVSVCTKWIEHIWLLLWCPHELCRAARTITQLSIHGVRLQKREPKTQSRFSFCQFTPTVRQSSHSVFSLYCTSVSKGTSPIAYLTEIFDFLSYLEKTFQKKTSFLLGIA